jgi:hypothetical protein
MENPETTTVHESRLAESPAAYQAPENHLFRKAYRELTKEEKDLMDAIKDTAYRQYLLYGAALIGAGPSDTSRAMAIARTKLEESVMWAVKAITA